MIYLVCAFFLSFVVCMLLVRFNRLHSHLTGDVGDDKVQGAHSGSVPRVGGLALAVAAVVAAVAGYLYEDAHAHVRTVLLLFLCAGPVFLGGLAEDILKVGLIKTRLLCMALSALLMYWLIGWSVTRVDIALVDPLLHYPWVAVALTVFAVVGVTNAINFIDGYNGLSSAVVIIMMVSLLYVAFQVGDRPVMMAALIMIGATFGFWLWNWPRGLIFLGDGGAYLLGFLVAALAIALVLRHPEVSAWYALVLMLYPIVETLFTIHRRLLRRDHPGLPDAAHLHQLLYKRVMRWAVGSSCPDKRTMRNSMTSPYLWMISSLAVVPATLWWGNALMLQLTTVAFIGGYIWLYRSISRFRSPRWLVYRNPLGRFYRGNK
ncbi:MraY family glycosyltransferase [Chitinibacteraceae bacterium HSL-7]